MGRIITTVITVVVLAVLVSMNLGFATSVNLFGRKFDNVSVVAVAALSFALGVVYSLFIGIGIFLHQRKKRALAGRDRRLTERETELAKRQKEAELVPVVSKEKNGISPVRPSWRARLRELFKTGP